MRISDWSSDVCSSDLPAPTPKTPEPQYCRRSARGRVMIEHLVVGSAAYFHSRKRRLSQDAIDRLFRSVRAQVSSPAQNLFRLVRAPIGDALCSAIRFSSERPVAFLDAEAEQVERAFGYLLIVWKADNVKTE